MTDHKPIFERMLAWGDAPMALATVVSTWGSAPRPRGSHMLVHADGRFEGSVSGGCVEGDVLVSALSTIETGCPLLKHYGISSGQAWEVGLPCGGDIEVLIQRVGSDGFPPELARAVLDAGQSGEELAITTDLVGGLSQSRTVAATPAGAKLEFTHTYRPPWRLMIVGAVQIAQSLVQIARALGLEPVVVDPRGQFLTAERFPDVSLDDRWPDEAIAAYRPNNRTAVVTLTHDTKLDDPALIAALDYPTGYIAALGSTRSHAARLKRLSTAGLSQEQLARIEGPAGIDIGALGPAEIALSIISGLVRVFRAEPAHSRETLKWDCGMPA